MNRFVLAAVLCGLTAIAVPAAAQVGPSNTYTDPGMSFTAPAAYRETGVGKFDPQSADPGSTTVATWVTDPGKPSMRVIQIQMEPFEGSLGGYVTLAENELREQIDGVFVSNKHPAALSNGMPAYWEEISIGDGFQEMKRYEYLWVDGTRGVVLSVMGHYGYMTEADAKKDLANASGVRYPANRE